LLPHHQNHLHEKVKKIMWLVAQKAILTRENMIKRNWQGDPGCYFCGAIESVDHLLFYCPFAKVVWGVVALSFHQRDRPTPYDQFDIWARKALPGGDAVYMFGMAAICWAIWKARNWACFEKKKLIINSNEVIYSACLFMPYWVRLYKGEMQDKVKAGADVLMKVALSIGEGPSLGTGRRMITDERVQDPEDGDVVQGFAGQASRGSDPEDMSF
jgi:hypothetical protein